MDIYFPLSNKYSQWYSNLIEKAKSRKLETAYKESHHIIPKCLGGDDSPNNLIELTLREHYIAHLLLSKMYKGEASRKMYYALWLMLLQEKKRGSKIFEMYRKMYIDRALKTQVISEETRQKISKAKTGKPITKTEKLLADWERRKVTNSGSGNPMFGRKHSEETIRKISQKAKQRVMSEETKQKISLSGKGRKLPKGQNVGERNPMFGKKHSEETRKKISEAGKRRFAKRQS
jgi:hypothetical protein